MYEVYGATYNNSLTGYIELSANATSLTNALRTVKEMANNGVFSIGVRFMGNGEWIYVRLPIRYSY